MAAEIEHQGDFQPAPSLIVAVKQAETLRIPPEQVVFNGSGWAPVQVISPESVIALAETMGDPVAQQELENRQGVIELSGGIPGTPSPLRIR